jgi:hypothetical protein
MDTVKQINQICIETDNNWFLTHDFTKIALNDLQLKETFENEGITNFDERECVCNQENYCNQEEACMHCIIETERNDILDALKINKPFNDNYEYTKSKWIIHDKIDGEIPGFILFKCTGDGFDCELFTHELVFACVRPKYRNKGILKNMITKIPKKWNIWLEANSNEIENVENIWEKCGFTYHTTYQGKYLIYKKISI